MTIPIYTHSQVTIYNSAVLAILVDDFHIDLFQGSIHEWSATGLTAVICVDALRIAPVDIITLWESIITKNLGFQKPPPLVMLVDFRGKKGFGKELEGVARNLENRIQETCLHQIYPVFPDLPGEGC